VSSGSAKQANSDAGAGLSKGFHALLTGVAARLEAGGRLAVGDLMAAGRDVVPALRRRLAHPDVDELFEDEYAWFVDETVVALAEIGFTRIAVEQLSDLSWGVAARLA